MTLHRDKLLGAGSLHSIRHRPRQVNPEGARPFVAISQAQGEQSNR